MIEEMRTQLAAGRWQPLHLPGELLTVDTTSFETLDVEAIAHQADVNTKIIFVCTPNNPTGDAIDTAKMMDFIGKIDNETRKVFPVCPPISTYKEFFPS